MQNVKITKPRESDDRAKPGLSYNLLNMRNFDKAASSSAL